MNYPRLGSSGLMVARIGLAMMSRRDPRWQSWGTVRGRRRANHPAPTCCSGRMS
jgi:hypothetical protein